jgi:hypothetical protein
MSTNPQRSNFYAALANIDALKDMNPADQERLIVDAVQAGLISSAFVSSADATITVKRPDKAFMQSWRGAKQGTLSGIPASWYPIFDVHPFARDLIRGFVDTGRADRAVVRRFEEALVLHEWCPDEWELNKQARRVEAKEVASGVIVYGLRDAIFADPFPFGRCKQCKRIYVPNKNQRYCGKACLTTAVQPWKNAYQKKLMRQRRKEGKAK